MFQVFHVLRGSLNIFENKCFQINDQTNLLSSADTEFYIVRALRVIDNEVEIKFLHQVVKKFHWPLRSNIDIVHNKRVSYGSKELKGTGPFNVPGLSCVERLFKYIRK